MMNLTETNYSIIKAQIIAIKKQLEKELCRNYDSINTLEKRQEEIKKEYDDLLAQLQEIGEFSLGLEYKFLEEIERNCTRCGTLYDKRHGSEKLCPACFTSNA